MTHTFLINGPVSLDYADDAEGFRELLLEYSSFSLESKIIEKLFFVLNRLNFNRNFTVFWIWRRNYNLEQWRFKFKVIRLFRIWIFRNLIFFNDSKLFWVTDCLAFRMLIIFCLLRIRRFFWQNNFACNTRRRGECFFFVLKGSRLIKWVKLRFCLLCFEKRRMRLIYNLRLICLIKSKINIRLLK